MSKALLKSTGIVSAMTSLSRISGFVRDMVYAQMFGAGTGTDAFFVAFRIPNFLRRLFAEGAFSQAFVPVFSEYQTQRSRAELQELVDQVAGTLGAILFIISAIGVLAAPVLILLFAPGFTADAGKYELTVAMLRITFPYLLFISLTAFAGSVLNSCGKFSIPAITPVLLNLTMIAAALWLAPRMERPVVGLAWGVFIAGVIQLGFQVPFLRQVKLLPRPRWGWASQGVQQVLKLMLPAIFGSSVAQVNLLIDTLLASFLVSGSVSWLYYGQRQLAVLLRPAGRISARHFRRCARDGDPAQVVPPARQRGNGWLFAHAGLGLALGAVDRHSGDGGTDHPLWPDLVGAIPVRPVRRPRRGDVDSKPDGIFPGLGRFHVDQSTRARFLCSPGYPQPGQIWRHRDGRQYHDGIHLHLAVGPCRIGAGHFARRLSQCRPAVFQPQAARDLPAAFRLDDLSVTTARCQLGDGAGALVWRGRSRTMAERPCARALVAPELAGRGRRGQLFVGGTGGGHPAAPSGVAAGLKAVS